MTKWKSIEVETLNQVAYELLKENTKALYIEGTDVEYFIKKKQ